MGKGLFVIGVDYGTDSVRSVIVDAHNGKELTSSVFNIRDGSRAHIAMRRKISFASTRLIMSRGWNKPSKTV